MPSHSFHSTRFSSLDFLFRLPRVAQADQDLLNLLMQARQHIDTHGHPGDEGALQSLRRGLAIFGRLGDRGEECGFDESEIDIGDSLATPTFV